MNKATVISLFSALLTVSPLFAEDDGHGHAAAPKTADELFTAQCEHKIPQYTCDECRYELGLVKIDPSLVRSAENAKGLLTFESVQKRVAQTLLPMNGEIALNASALTHVSPRVPGTVRTIHVDLGRQVKKGDVLFEIESPELGLAIGAYRKNKALAALALKNLEREKALVAQKLSPEADAVEAQMKYDEYRIELESAANALRVMGLDDAAVAALTADGATGKGARLPVLAPLSGTVIEKHLDPGETVETGKDVLTIADLSSVWVWMSVYERDLARLLAVAKKGPTRVQVSTLAFEDMTFEGVIDLVGSAVDEEDRTVKVRATLKNPDALLRPGMFCEANAVFETQEKVVAVPKAALLADEGKHFVFRLVREGFVLRTDVAVGRRFADSVEITGGISEGEKIVTGGAFVCKSDVLRAKMGAGCAD
ncbi:MAG: efflux RND transporter periplasmic adaptor subunit [Kiritimatiellae bacterium]|nr:efflux RND transporter periplasmic adaptor subunit [Kiritimatiellia bacterium]